MGNSGERVFSIYFSCRRIAHIVSLLSCFYIFLHLPLAWGGWRKTKLQAIHIRCHPVSYFISHKSSLVGLPFPSSHSLLCLIFCLGFRNSEYCISDGECSLSRRNVSLFQAWCDERSREEIASQAWCNMEYTRNVEAFFQKDCYCISPKSKEKGQILWYTLAAFFKNASALRVLE